MPGSRTCSAAYVKTEQYSTLIATVEMARRKEENTRDVEGKESSLHYSLRVVLVYIQVESDRNVQWLRH